MGGSGGACPPRSLRYLCLGPRGGLGGFAPQESPLITRALPPQRPCLAPVPCPQFFFVQIFSSEFFRRNFFVGIFSSEFFSSVVGPSSIRPSSVVRRSSGQPPLRPPSPPPPLTNVSLSNKKSLSIPSRVQAPGNQVLQELTTWFLSALEDKPRD